MDIPCMYLVDIHGISLMDIHGGGYTWYILDGYTWYIQLKDIHGTSKDKPCIYHAYSLHICGIYQAYSRHIPKIILRGSSSRLRMTLSGILRMTLCSLSAYILPATSRDAARRASMGNLNPSCYCLRLRAAGHGGLLFKFLLVVRVITVWVGPHRAV